MADRDAESAARKGRPWRLRMKGARYADTILIACVYSALVAAVPSVFDAVQVLPDEGFELMKGFLCWKGYALYRDIWNDQPPLHTLLLKWLFAAAGASVTPARWLTVGFGAVLVLSLHWLVKMTCGTLAGILAPLLLLLSPSFLASSVAVTLEVPAFAVALASLVCAQRYLTQRQGGMLILSSLLAALALHVKLTAGLVFPSLLALLLSGRKFRPHGAEDRGALVGTARLSSGEGWSRNASDLLATSIWLLVALVVFVALSLLLGSDFSTAYRSHFSQAVRTFSAKLPEYRFGLGCFLLHPEGVCGVTIAVGFMLLRRHFYRLIVPVTMFAVALFAHTFHYPWWPYYYLHLEIPMAWLSGYALATALAECRPFVVEKHRLAVASATIGASTASLILASVLAEGWPRLRHELACLKAKQLVASDPLVAEIAKRRMVTKWIYAPGHDGSYAFHAGIPVPPELAVLPYKRFWCGEITDALVFDVVRQYEPEQLLLPSPGLRGRWKMLEDRYRIVLTTPQHVLYVLNEYITNAVQFSPAHGSSLIPNPVWPPRE